MFVALEQPYRLVFEKMGHGAVRCVAEGELTAPHEAALFAMAANRLDAPGSKLACATRWLPDVAFLPDAAGLGVDQLYRALDFLAVWSDRIERQVFLKTADLFRLDVDLIFYDTTTAYFEIDEADEQPEEWGGRLFAPLRRRGHSKEGRDNQPQVIIALAVTRDGMPVRSWVLPGDTADVATVARIKDDLRAWQLGRCVFVGDAGMYSAENLAALSRGLGRYILAVPMRKIKEIEVEVLARGDAPRLQELRMHNGTIYRWNRPVYDVYRGKPHLRVENRVLPAGPTVVDVLANGAFYYGLLRVLAGQDRPVWSQMSFAAAADNFNAGARHGIDARIYWPGLGEVPATELVLRRLLPLAHEGLAAWGVDSSIGDRLLGIIEQRCIARTNGAEWQVRTFHSIDDEKQPLDRRDALREMLRRYVEHMHTNEPVHTWQM